MALLQGPERPRIAMETGRLIRKFPTYFWLSQSHRRLVRRNLFNGSEVLANTSRFVCLSAIPGMGDASREHVRFARIAHKSTKCKRTANLFRTSGTSNGNCWFHRATARYVLPRLCQVT